MLCKLMQAKAKLSLRLYRKEEEGKTTQGVQEWNFINICTFNVLQLCAFSKRSIQCGCRSTQVRSS